MLPAGRPDMGPMLQNVIQGQDVAGLWDASTTGVKTAWADEK